MQEILDIIHKTIYQFFDVCGDDEETPMSDKDKLLLEVNKAIYNNLKALEKEPCNDCISRQMANNLQRYRYNCGDTSIVCVSLKDINDLPPVQPEQKIGHWITLEDEWGDIVEAVCSCCDSNGHHKWKYCPNCNARMIESLESEDKKNVLL